MKQLLEPLFEPLFHQNSCGFRPMRNAHQAIEKVLDIWHSGYRYVLDADIKGFFDNIPHHIIMTGLSNVVAEGNILDLIERFLKSGVMENGVFKPTNMGTPQGGVISPLLANIALNFLDWHLQEHGLHFVRYADDFEKFKNKIRELTVRSYNLDKRCIIQLNQVIRGTAHYFAPPFSHNRSLVQ